MAKRPRYSRWRRLPEVFRTGEHKHPAAEPEVQRVTVQLPVHVFETVESLVAKLEKTSVREYCAELLTRAVEEERLRHHVEEYEAKHGPLEGLQEIAEDPVYLSEWEARSRERGAASSSPDGASSASPDHYVNLFATKLPLELEETREPIIPEVLPIAPNGNEREAGSESASVSESEAFSLASSGRPDRSIAWSVEPVVTSIREIPMRESLVESPSEIVLRHAGLGTGGMGAGDDHWSFLPSLRRGEPVAASMVEELLEAMARLEEENRAATTVDRRLARALHRLAFEAQVLLTEAWPGVFDERMVLAIRAVQEAVERNLSGEDIRYYPAESSSQSESAVSVSESSR